MIRLPTCSTSHATITLQPSSRTERSGDEAVDENRAGMSGACDERHLLAAWPLTLRCLPYCLLTFRLISLKAERELIPGGMRLHLAHLGF